MKEPKPRSDKAFQRDQWMALHQKRCWLILAATAAIGAVAIVWLLPLLSQANGAPEKGISTETVSSILTIALAMGLMLVYRWAANAPVRAIREWSRRMNTLTAPEHAREYQEKARAFWEFLTQMEQNLPSLRKKELAFPLCLNKSALLIAMDRKEEALSLLRSFDQIWDKSQADRIAAMIRIVQTKMAEENGAETSDGAGSGPKEQE